MKRILPVFVAASLAICCFTNNAFAIKPFGDAWGKFYVESSENEEFKKLAGEAKCNVCHIDKEKKDKRNPYGEALDKLLSKDDYKAERLKNEADKVKEELEAAFKKVEEEKAKDGKTFKEHIEAGKLPGGDIHGK